VDAAGNLYIADSGNYRVRKLAVDGTISTVAGTGVYGNSGDGGPAISAQIGTPRGVTVDASGNLFIAFDQNVVRKVSPGGTISTVAGTGTSGYSGDGGLATSAQFTNPYNMTSDPAGNIYVSDTANNAVRVLQPAGVKAVFTVSATHTGNFAAGQSGATYTVTVSNAALAAASSGLVTVTETVPSGLTFSSMSGAGWACSSNSCTRSDPLPAGGSYPSVTVAVNVDSGAPPQVTNLVAVTGGGSLGAAAADPTFVGSATPALQITSTHYGTFAAGQNATYTVTVGNRSASAATTSTVTVTESLPSSAFTLVSMAGTGWDCIGNACMRGDALPGGGAYPPITVTVTVAVHAPTQATNQVTVSGGGSANATASDVTSITSVPCDATGDGLVTVADVQLIINEALGLAAAVDDLNHDGVVNVADIQKEINAALGLGCQ